MKPYPVLCRDCKFSVPEQGSEWNLRCLNPRVNAKDSWALSANGRISGTNCNTERSEKGFFVSCGMKGKLWELKQLGGRV